MADKEFPKAQKLVPYIQAAMAAVKDLAPGQIDAVLRACLSLNSTEMITTPKPF